MKIKKTIALEESVMADVQEYAESNGLTFTGALSVLARQALQAQKAVQAASNLSTLMDEVKKLIPGGAGEAPGAPDPR